MPIQQDAIRELIETLLPGASVRRMAPMGVDDDATGDATSKGIGYGQPLRLSVDHQGRTRELVWHTATSDRFGHDRRSDRAREMLLAYDTFDALPGHVAAIDVGAVAADGSLRSLSHSGEFYLLTEFAPGEIYAADLRHIAHRCALEPRDVRRCDALVDSLIAIHRSPIPAEVDHPLVYARAIRDLVGHGEGIFGIIDGYPADTPSAGPERLSAIEERCRRYRWTLRDRHHRLTRTHSDFHPFNIIFDNANTSPSDGSAPDHSAANDRPRLLDAARGSLGDPADDVTCLALNYIFFSFDQPGSWQGAFVTLWRRFWDRYRELSDDSELLVAAPPFLTWRALVLANPVWYPGLASEARDRLLRLAETALDAGRFDPRHAEELL